MTGVSFAVGWIGAVVVFVGVELLALAIERWWRR